MARDRQEISRRQSAVRRAVLKRLQQEDPERYAQWTAEAYAALNQQEASQ